MFRKKPTQHPRIFLDRVQRHEQEWGTDSYPNKPTLTEIINANVVVFWIGNDREQRETITLHADTRDVEFMLGRQLLRSSIAPIDKRMRAIYQNQKQLRIKAFRVVFTPIEE